MQFQITDWIIASHFANCKVNSSYCNCKVVNHKKNGKRFFSQEDFDSSTAYFSTAYSTYIPTQHIYCEVSFNLSVVNMKKRFILHLAQALWSRICDNIELLILFSLQIRWYSSSNNIWTENTTLTESVSINQTHRLLDIL